MNGRVVRLNAVGSALAALASRVHVEARQRADADLTAALAPLLEEHGITAGATVNLSPVPGEPGAWMLVTAGATGGPSILPPMDGQQVHVDTLAPAPVPERPVRVKPEPTEYARGLAAEDRQRLEALRAAGVRPVPTEDAPRRPSARELLATSGVELGG